jgi:hypothetical protein
MVEKKKLFMIMVLLIMTGLISVYLQTRGGGQDKSKTLPVHVPMELFPWRGSAFSASMPWEVEPDDFVLRSYQTDHGRPINLLALYSRISNYHPPALCYQGAGRQLTEVSSIASSSGKIRLAGLMGRRNSDIILVYHGFYIGGKIIPDGIEKKAYEVREKLMRGYVKQYFFEVTVNVFNDDHGQAVSYIRKFLDDMEPYVLRVSS